MRLLILQYAGDYREAVQRFARGGSENYYAQKYSVNVVAEFTQYCEAVINLCCLTEQPYDEVLENGVRAIGAGFQGLVDEDEVIRLIEQQQPTHLLVGVPMRKVLRWAIQKRLKVINILSESMVLKSWRDRFRGFRLRQLLNHPQIDWVGSYGMTAAKQLRSLGVKPEKIVPWDLLIENTPGSYPPKMMQYTAAPWKLIYVGSLSESKGVGDVLRAIAQLRQQKFPVQLKVVGRDGDGAFAKLAAALQIADVVEFAGIIPNPEVVPEMRAADVVLVPSWHEYTEGFPLTIHHALCARTPIIASDHPMFRDHLKHGVSAMIFRAQDPLDLATAIQQLLGNAELYAALSAASYDTWYQTLLPVKWGDLVQRWLLSTPADTAWLQQHCLAAGTPSLPGAAQPVPAAALKALINSK